MVSQIYDYPDDDQPPERILARIDARIARYDQNRADIAARRRALHEPAFKTVVADPVEMHHKITLGAVMVNEGLAAADANALTGLLSLSALELSQRLAKMAARQPNARAAIALLNVMDQAMGDLTARGLYDTWSRRFAIYQMERAEWLALDLEYRLNGKWRQETMTTGQQWLIRNTCRIRRIDLPGHLLRGEAGDWLEQHGANLSYREFVA